MKSAIGTFLKAVYYLKSLVFLILAILVPGILIPHCAFHLLFPWWLVMLNFIFYIFIGHLDKFCEAPVQVFLFLSWLSFNWFMRVLTFLRDFPGGSEGKASVCNAGDPHLIAGSGRSLGEGNDNPTPVFLPGKSHGQRSYSPLGHKNWKWHSN